MCAAAIVYQPDTLREALEINCNWQYDLVSKQLTIWTDKDVLVYDEDAIQLLKDQLPPGEDDGYHPIALDDEMQFSEVPYDERSSSLYTFLSNFWKKKEGRQETRRTIAYKPDKLCYQAAKMKRTYAQYDNRERRPVKRYALSRNYKPGGRTYHPRRRAGRRYL